MYQDEKELMKSTENSRKIKDMMKTPGWKILQEYLEKKLKRYSNIMNIEKKKDDTEFIFTRKVIEHQAKYDTYFKFIAFMGFEISKGSVAEDILKKRSEKEQKNA